jgi:aspartate/methionine/tyrosine aminotransferase
MSGNRFDGIIPSPLSLLEKIARVEREKRLKIIRFDVAEPTFPPPEKAVKGTIEALIKGRYKYSSSWGIPKLRTAISDYLKTTRGITFAENEVLVTTGGKFANYAFFSGLLKKGDSVVLIKPYWVSFKAVPTILGINAIEVWAKDPYHLDQEAMKAVMSKRPRAVVVNTPNNPTGGLLNESDLKFLRDLAKDFDFLILSDEIDWAYVYDHKKFVSPASFEDLKERTIISDGFSKVFGMTGWRVGFAAGQKELIKRMHVVQEHSVSAPATFAQYGCLSALEGYADHIKKVLRLCSSNRRMVVRALSVIKGISCPVPEGGFYAYPRILEGRFAKTEDFANALLENAGVAVVPGEHFGDNRGHFRLCYALPPVKVSAGLKRIAEFLGSR